MGADPVSFVLFAAFGSILLAVLFIDIEYYIIPDSLNACLLPVAAALNLHQIAIGGGAGWVEIGGLAVPTALGGYVVGWGTLFGIALFGRLLLQRDAMGHGDIKLARGIGAMLGPGLALGAFALAVLAGAALGAAQVLVRKRSEAADADDEGVADAPEPVVALLRSGVGYLLMVDVLALFLPVLNQVWFGDSPEDVEDSADDDWEPSLTTIPFGPYLAVGALAAAAFPEPLLAAGKRYLEWATGAQ